MTALISVNKLFIKMIIFLSMLQSIEVWWELFNILCSQGQSACSESSLPAFPEPNSAKFFELLNAY